MTTAQRDITTAKARVAENTLRREQDYAAFERWMTARKSETWRRLGRVGTEQAARLERLSFAQEVVLADEVMNKGEIEQRAKELVEAFIPAPKRLRSGEAKDNARSALFEALVASGHMSVVELKGDIETVHDDVMRRLLNSYYREGIAKHERDRNFAEICEELRIQETLQRITAGDMPPETKVVTISDFADALGNEADKHGYRTANCKGMIRETSLVWRDGGWVRQIKQLSRSNAHAAETVGVLEKAGLSLPVGDKPDVALLGTQLLSVRHGAVEVMRLLDKLSGKGTRFGEPVSAYSPAYETIEQRSRERESEMAVHIERLAAYEKELDNQLMTGEITPRQQQQRYLGKLREHIRAICIRFPEYTRDALGEAVVGDYEKAHEQYAQGDTGGAASTVQGASGREAAVVVCGGAVSAEQANANNADETNGLQSLLEHTKMREKRWVGCPFCHTDKAFYGDPCAQDMDCRECGAYTRGGQVKYRGNGGKRTTRATVSENTNTVDKKKDVLSSHQERFVQELFGEHAVLHLRVTVGGVETDVIDRRSHEVIIKNIALPQNTY